MAEELNTEIARTLHERAIDEDDDSEPGGHWHEKAVEIVEAVLLAVVAIATAWSGYQAARWDGENARAYAVSARVRAEANQAWTLGGQQRLFDSSNFSAWLEARTAGNTQLAALYARRYSPEYAIAFAAWIRAGGLTNPNAPPGPSFMPQYHNHDWERAARLERQASADFTAGTQARHDGEDFIRTTVVFATVLFLVAVGQRFRIQAARRGLIVVSLGLLAFALYLVVTTPLAP
jgi:hypothetical protein